MFCFLIPTKQKLLTKCLAFSQKYGQVEHFQQEILQLIIFKLWLQYSLLVIIWLARRFEITSVIKIPCQRTFDICSNTSTNSMDVSIYLTNSQRVECWKLSIFFSQIVSIEIGRLVLRGHRLYHRNLT